MVAVSVGDINRCQVVAARRDPIYEDVRLLDGDKGVYEDGVSLEISVDDIGDHISCFVPGARSLVRAGMPGVTSTSHFSGGSRPVATSVISLFPLLISAPAITWVDGFIVSSRV
jgi:hypothetical protein